MARKIQRPHIQRGYAEYVEGTKVRYFWEPCGHSKVHDYSKGPISKRMQSAGAKMMASWHSKAKGGVTLEACSVCEKAKRRRLRQAVPPCAASMGCLCAGHAHGNPATAPCDTSDELLFEKGKRRATAPRTR